ncbi:RhuM family protein [Chitinophaga ginsengisegetis]|uniref:RhuM family protein n=1 Tax=Chitinophaga ginsengisegetis TaxID=393003 RepID=UPI000DB994DC|nr:RhuM family protein [Chitinophaga ginsengisegetis]MDR6566576.1 prophage maintenance system killer protein [Chitinophaga ginsengisegetis]MDR6646306.1 prophage maintenance system killer protein [Chitinophaga ginsengisegetis]MDR6652656.1 prophage maintenance system killer protein [Chitinophaga ginsengisegetis]
MEENQILIYQTVDGETVIDVKLVNDTIWLNQKQIAELFGTEVPAISKHITNIHKTKELPLDSTVSKMEIVRKEGKREVKRLVDHYNLDMIVSVGYRVNSIRGTQFRIWANKVLKDYIAYGYAIDRKRFQEESMQLNELKQTVKLLGKVAENQILNSDEAIGLLKVITDYTYALDVLDQYDHQVLQIEATSPENIFEITYHSAMDAIRGLRDKFGGSSLFGNEKDESFQGSLAAIYQTFGGQYLYPSVEEKAANLLYFVTKNHSFSDGNKRIAAFLFVWFLEKNGILYHFDGSKKIADNALVALTLMIAESKPDEKEMMIKVVVNLINLRN